MATTRGWALNGNINNAINYVLDLKHDEKKTGNGYYTYSSVENASAKTAGYFFKKERGIKHRKSVGYHFQFSLPYGEGDEKTCLIAAREWFESFTNDEVDYVIAVHNDRNSIHAHVIANSYKKDGSYWNVYWKKDVPKFKEVADRVCEKHGFSTLDNPRGESQRYYEWLDDRTDNNRVVVQKILDELVNRVATYDELKEYLRKIGFTVYDDLEEQEEQKNTFTFTVDKKLIQSQGDDGRYCVRIPYTKDYIYIDVEEFEWLKQDKTAKITIPIDKNVEIYNQFGKYESSVKVDQLKKNFEEKNNKKSNRKGLRIKPMGSKSVIRADRLGNGQYSRESLQQRILENGRLKTDPHITEFLSQANNSYSDIKNEQRRIFADSNIRVDFEQSTIYKSLKQENYFKWRSRQASKRMDQYNYKHLLEKDRKNIDVMQSRCNELRKELKAIYADIEKVDQTVKTMTFDKLENTMKSDIDAIDKYVTENRVPLEKRKGELKDMIRLYEKRIENVNIEIAKEQQNARNEKVRERVR